MAGPAECVRAPVSAWNTFDELFEQALTDHDRVLLWLFHIWVESGIESESANRDKRLSSKLLGPRNPT